MIQYVFSRETPFIQRKSNFSLYLKVVKYPGMSSSHSQEHLNDVNSSSGPVKVVTTGGNVPTQPVSRPVILPPGNSSPKTQRQTADFAAQLTGKGLHGDSARAGQGKPIAGVVLYGKYFLTNH